MEERLTRLEQDNAQLKKNVTVLERKLKQIELQIRKLDRVAQQKRTKGVR